VTIVEFVNARLDEEEQAAKAATQYDPAPWESTTSDDRPTNADRDPEGISPHSGWVLNARRENLWDDEGCLAMGAAAATHIARHDPARVLRDIAAKRAIVAAYLPAGGDPHPGLPCINYEGQDPANYSEWDTCSRHIKASERRIHHDYVIRLLASAWSDHPDCDPAWAA